MVGTGRFELPTPRTPSECSTRLSHVPTQSSRLARSRLWGPNQFTPALPCAAESPISGARQPHEGTRSNRGPHGCLPLSCSHTRALFPLPELGPIEVHCSPNANSPRFSQAPSPPPASATPELLFSRASARRLLPSPAPPAAP